MTLQAQQVLNQIAQMVRQLEQTEAQNAVRLQQGGQLGEQEQQQFAMLEQNAAQQLGQIQRLLQQYQNQQNSSPRGYGASTNVGNRQPFTGAGMQSIMQPGFAGTDAEEVRRQNQQSSQNQNGYR